MSVTEILYRQSGHGSRAGAKKKKERKKVWIAPKRGNCAIAAPPSHGSPLRVAPIALVETHLLLLLLLLIA